MASREHTALLGLLIAQRRSAWDDELYGRTGCIQATYCCSLAIVHSKMLFQGLVDFASTLKHAWGGSADHDVKLAHLGSVEHGVECCHLVHSDRRQIQNLRYLCSRLPILIWGRCGRTTGYRPMPQLALFIALRLSQPWFCFCARSSKGMTADAL